MKDVNNRVVVVPKAQAPAVRDCDAAGEASDQFGRQHVTSAHVDLNRWCDSVTNLLQSKGIDSDVFLRQVENVRTVLDRLEEEKPLFVPIETLKALGNIGRYVRTRAAFKMHSGVRVAVKVQEEPDLASLIRAPKCESHAVSNETPFVRFNVFCFGEADAERHLIETLPCTDEGVLDRFQRSGTQLMYELGGIVVVNPLKKKFMLLLTDLRAIESPLDLIEPSPEELQKAEDWILSAGGRSPIPAMRDILVEEMSIFNADDPLECAALEVAILQAASHGRINGESARIHTAEIGSPGVGKGKRNRVREAIQPVCKHVDAQAVTEDGLYGNAGNAGGKRVVRAGLVPQAHQGCFVIEDINQANSLKNQRFIIALGATMETGRCEAGNASRSSYAAEVAFSVDSNRNSDVDSRKRPRNGVGGLDLVTHDTGLPVNLLSRVDFLVEYPRDIKKQLHLSMAIARQPVVVGHDDGQGRSGVRMIQVALALLRKRIPSVRMDEAVTRHLEERYRSIVNVRQTILVNNPRYGDFLTRGAKSYKKFVAAYARLCNRDVATVEDVDACFGYVLAKFETVLTWILGDTSDDATQATRKEARQLLLRIRYRGRRVTLGDVRRLIPGVSTKTLKRDLEDVAGNRDADDTWLVPDAAPGSPDACVSSQPDGGPADTNGNA